MSRLGAAELALGAGLASGHPCKAALDMAFVLLHFKGVIFTSCDSRCRDPESNVAMCMDEPRFDRIVLLPFSQTKCDLRCR